MIPRYTTPELGRIWSDQYRYETWLKIEIAVCEVLCEMGDVPSASLAVIKEKAAFDIQGIEEIEETTRHDVIAFLTNVAGYVGPDSRFIHQGMTSSDLLDTALALQCVEAGKEIRKRLVKFIEVTKAQAQKYKYTWQIGRTHGIHAEPITFGLKLALWSLDLERGLVRLDAALEEIATGKISGAVGTFAHLSPAVEEKVCQQLGLSPAPISTQIVQRDRHAGYLSAIALVGAAIEKIALEIRHLQRTEVREAEEPFRKGQKGSSAMPHKRNPIVTEQMCGMARLLRTNALAAMENIALWHERDISHSSIERVILPDSTTLIHYMLGKMINLIDDLLVYPERMLENLNASGGLIFSQNILLALIGTGLTREDAYAMVQKHAMKVWNEGGNFQAELKADDDVGALLDDSALDACFDYEHLKDNIDQLFKRAGLN